MFRHLSLAGHYFLMDLKNHMAYRIDFFMECLAGLVADSAGLVVVWILFSKTTMLGVWSLAQVVFIYALAMVTQALFRSISFAFWFFPNRYIIMGEFDRILMRPVNPLLQIMIENLRIQALPSALIGVLLLVVSSSHFAFIWTFTDVALLIIFVCSGVVMLTGIFLGLITMSFWFEDRVGFAQPVYNFMAFGKYPLTIFNSPIRFILSFVLPFGFMAFYPATHFLSPGYNPFAIYCYLTPVAALVVFALGYGFWSIGVKNYKSTGS